MGADYGRGLLRAVTQWSDGSYKNATNSRQDDLAVITSGANGFGYRADDYGNTFKTAQPLKLFSGEIATGIIERNDDFDFFAFDVVEPGGSLTIGGYESITNLDVSVSVYNEKQRLVQKIDPADSLSATVDLSNYAPGRYYLAVTGTGLTVNGDVRYSDYGSLGYYRIEATIPEPNVGLSAPTGLTSKPSTTGVELSWTPVQGAESYFVQVFSANSPVVSLETSTPNASIDGLSPSTSYRAVVVAMAPNVDPSLPAELTFTTNALGKLPKPNVTAETYLNTINLSWSAINLATSYTVSYKAANDQNYTSVVVNDTTYAITDLTLGTTYTVRVRANADGIERKNSDNTVQSVEVPFILMTPPTNVVATPQVTSAVIAWDSVAYATGYQVAVYQGDVAVFSGETRDTSITVTGLSATTEYRATIVALPPTIESTTSAIDVAPSEPAECVFTTVALRKLPKPNVTAETYLNTINLSWSAINLATSYTVSYKAANDQNYTSVVVNDTTYAITDLTLGTTYTVRVRANADGIERKNSDNTVQNIEVPLIVMTPPTNVVATTQVTSVVLTWDAVEYADSYYVVVYEGDKVVASGEALEPSFTVAGLSESTDYRATIVALPPVITTSTPGTTTSTVIDSSEPATLSFTTNALRKLPKPNVTAETYLNTINLSWSAINRATSYTVSYRAADSKDYTSVVVNDTTYAITDLELGTSYVVRVRANADGIERKNSDNTVQSVEVPFILMTPPTNVVATPQVTSAVIAWDSVAYATGYQVAVYQGDVAVFSGETRDTSITVTGLSESTDYRATIVALPPVIASTTSSSVIAPSAEAELTFTTNALRKLPKPNVKAETYFNTINLSWSAVNLATSYTVSYRAADSKNYTSVVVNDTTYAITDLAFGTSYVVRVRANADGIERKNSDNTVQNIEVPFPVLATPTNLDATTQVTNAVFTWDSVDFADSYQVVVYQGNAVVATGVVNETSFVVSGLSESTEYVAKVNALSTEFASSECAELVFTTNVLKRMAKLNVEETVYYNSIILNWNANRDATSYTVSYKAENDKTFTNVVVDDTLYAITDLEYGTTYTVRVRANGDGIEALNSYYTVQNVEIPYAVLATPTNFVATTQVTNAVLTWDAVDFAESYQVIVYQGVTAIASGVVNETSFVVSGLSESTEYTATVIALANQIETSGPAELTFTTIPLKKMARPNVMMDVKANSIVLNWNANRLATSYTVSYKAENDKTYTNVVVNDTTYALNDLAYGTTYTVRVRANGDGVEALTSDYKTLSTSIETEVAPAL